MERMINQNQIEKFRKILTEEEKSQGTIKKYIHDLQVFGEFLGENNDITKEAVICYKQNLMEKYAPVTVNGILASLNTFFRHMGWHEYTVKTLKIQRDSFRAQNRELSKEEYRRLLDTAKQEGKTRLYLLMQTICSTGIRVSELQFITVESLCTRRARVSLKGKTRTVLIPSNLCRELRQYARVNQISRGSVFVTKNGHPLDRSNIFRAMKSLCEKAKVEKDKVFPHNLRHLFACAYYEIEKDIAHLADILGHSNINTTRIYLLKSSLEQERQIESLGLII